MVQFLSNISSGINNWISIFISYFVRNINYYNYMRPLFFALGIVVFALVLNIFKSLRKGF